MHGTEVVLKHANKKKRLVVIASTSEVYGKSTDVPFREDADLVLGPTHAAPLGVRVQQGHRRVPGARLLEGTEAAGHHRPAASTPSGPRQTGRYGMVIPNFVRQALAGAADHGVRRRHAVAQLHLRRRRRRRARAARRASRRAVGQVFNIGNGEEISIRDLAEKVKAHDRQRPRRSCTIPYDQAYEAGFEDMPRRVPDLTQDPRRSSATSRRVGLDEILERVIDAHAAAGRRLRRAGVSGQPTCH